MFCAKCGKEVSDNIQICPYCGAVLNNNKNSLLFRDNIMSPPEIEEAIRENRSSVGAGEVIAGILFVIIIFILVSVITAGVFSLLK